MRVNLIKIGNSRGIIIPATLLAACGLGEVMELQLENGKIIIEPLTQPRAGWFDNFQPEADEPALDDIPLDEDSSEWTW